METSSVLQQLQELKASEENTAFSGKPVQQFL